jgi:hypothetical protein
MSQEHDYLRQLREEKHRMETELCPYCTEVAELRGILRAARMLIAKELDHTFDVVVRDIDAVLAKGPGECPNGDPDADVFVEP